jgi:hypothetical protein
MLNVEGFHIKSRYCKGFRAFNIIPHILKAAVPTPIEEYWLANSVPAFNISLNNQCKDE